MLFNSFSFLLFFPIVVAIYYLAPHKWRSLILLIASSYFYMAFVPKYILILFFLIATDFFLAKQIEKNQGEKRKILLFVSILANLGTLFVFKYFNFFSDNVGALARLIHWNYSLPILSIVLPLGLSFHVFQSLSYVIEVYRGKYRAENNLLTYALYVMFFPQLVAGPIERPYNLLPQLKQEQKFGLQNLKAGLERMLWGFFKKIVIADNLAAYVDQAYLYPQGYSGLILLTATFFFAIQLYCDFSGYSDIAIGGAQVLGIKLIENFNYPYLSRSMAEYWRRWHMSLSNWLRDYLYYPLVFSIKAHVRTRLYLALFITMVLIGLWHGADWTFVAFGALHGFYMVFGQITQKSRQWIVRKVGFLKFPRLYHFWQTLLTFSLACIGFVFFRAATLGDAGYILIHSFNGLIGFFGRFVGVTTSLNQATTPALFGFLNQFLLDGEGRRQFLFLIFLVLFFVLAEAVSYSKTLNLFSVKYRWVRAVLYFSAVLAIMNLGVTHEIPFIYFQF